MVALREILGDAQSLKADRGNPYGIQAKICDVGGHAGQAPEVAPTVPDSRERAG
jgi:hypothetical protein